MTRSEREPFTNTAEPFTNGGSGNATGRSRKSRPNLRCATPKTLNFRFKHIVEAERRTQATVIDKMIGDFLAVKEYEPRPYLPDEVAGEDTVSVAYTLKADMYDEFCRRASVEGRIPQALFIRAMYDYVENSPDDPFKHGIAFEDGSNVPDEKDASHGEDDGDGGGEE